MCENIRYSLPSVEIKVHKFINFIGRTVRKLDIRREMPIDGTYYLIYSDGLVAFGIGKDSKITFKEEYNFSLSFGNAKVTVFEDDGEGINYLSYGWHYYELTEEEVINCIMIPNI